MASPSSHTRLRVGRLALLPLAKVARRSSFLDGCAPIDLIADVRAWAGLSLATLSSIVEPHDTMLTLIPA
jgi:hypothetical protein